MSSWSQTAQMHGQYTRRLLSVERVPGGVRATTELISFSDVGDERRPVIVSDEPLASQALATNVPNQPGEVATSDTDRTRPQLLLDIRVLARHIVRIRLGTAEQLAHQREFGILAPGALEALRMAGPLPARRVAVVDQENMTIAVVEDITMRFQHDPFGISIACAGLPDATIQTPLDDRNVHGLLCTPPPGLYETVAGTRESFWSWALTPDERIYGLGERFTPLDQRGEQITLWDTDAWGTTTESSYKYVPFLHSSRGYGLFFHTPAPLDLKLGTPSLRAAHARVEEAELDLFVVFGATPKEILAEYTRLTGRATVPPRWAFGVWLSRCRYQTRAEVEDVARRARAEDIPCDVLHLDPAWLEKPGLSCDFVASETNFPDLAGMVRGLREQGFKISLWELPYVSERAPGYAEAAASGYFLRDEHGEPISADFSTAPADGHIRAVLDFTNPAARAWWQDQHRPWLRAGVEVFKTDFGEGVPEGARAANDMTGRQLHNVFPLLYNAAVHEVISDETGRPGMVWGRSGWAGTQRYPAQWGGDPKTDVWSMRSSLRGGLNLAVSAPGIWTHDIGGFYGPPPSPELYIRWSQFGLLSPLARAHGTTPREPWEFGRQACAIFRRYAKLRMRLNPYLYSLAWESHERGLPMLRPLMLEYPDDPVAATIDDAYQLGADLLVAPVFDDSPEPVERHLYLPPGTWVDFWTDERMEGGRYITRTAPLDTLPLYIRAGGILPLGPEFSFLGDDVPAGSEMTLEVYPGVERETHVVWDREGAATAVRLREDQKGWRLELDGTCEMLWRIRWHTTNGIRHHDLGRVASGSATLAERA